MQNKIRMRVNKDVDCVCKVCGATRKNSLELFDIAFTDKHIITICDLCNQQLFNKTLKAECSVNSKLKSQHDIHIINNRKHKIEIEEEKLKRKEKKQKKR